jgi:hypothetical protein
MKIDDPANNAGLIKWARDYWSALHPLSAGGGYVNMMMDECEDNVKAAYRDNYPRLAAIKKAVDPGQSLPDQPEHQAGLTSGVCARAGYFNSSGNAGSRTAFPTTF